ncbi:MAG: DNA/RNA nuclease SfsA [Chloroflexota bacterium]
MRFNFYAQAATFLERPNRFRIAAKLQDSGEVVNAHCPNPGRLQELLIPGATVYVSPATNPARKTGYDLRFVEHPEHGTLISLDTRLPNDVAEEGLQNRCFEPLASFTTIEREVTIASAHHSVQSRIDFRLKNSQDQQLWLEVKSVSLVQGRQALFPDAPTERGRRHLEELVHRVKEGEQAAVLFIVQRPDADEVRPHWETDPQFAQALMDAKAAGVTLFAYTCRVTTEEVQIDRAVPVITSTAPLIKEG